MAKIIIRWKKIQFFGSATRFDVYLMNTYIGELRYGGTLEISAEVGSYTLFFKQKNLRIGKKADTVFVAVVNYETEIVELTTKFDINGNFVVSYADNAPHILANHNAPGYISPNTINSANQINKALTEIKKEARKSNGCLDGCLTFILIVSIFFLISIFVFRNGVKTDISKPSKPVEKTMQTEQTTDEEKAQLELERASSMFSDGDYKSALEICENIKTQYPDTAPAVNINNYINEQYKQYPAFTANQLMAEYESNIVNADKEYTGKTVIVSGIISSFDKTNHDKNLCVLLQSGEYFKAVQLNFNTSQTDSVAALSKGTNIKVIGKCSGKSGKQFILFDGENVMIEDCLLIK